MSMISAGTVQSWPVRGMYLFILNTLFLVVEATTQSSPNEWVAAVRRLANRQQSKPADPKVSRAQPP